MYVFLFRVGLHSCLELADGIVDVALSNIYLSELIMRIGVVGPGLDSFVEKPDHLVGLDIALEHRESEMIFR